MSDHVLDITGAQCEASEPGQVRSCLLSALTLNAENQSHIEMRNNQSFQIEELYNNSIIEKWTQHQATIAWPLWDVFFLDRVCLPDVRISLLFYFLTNSLSLRANNKHKSTVNMSSSDWQTWDTKYWLYKHCQIVTTKTQKRLRSFLVLVILGIGVHV